MRARICIWFVFILATHMEASSHALEVRKIEITGHHRTKELTILRELDFSIGDTIPLTELTQRLERNRSNLLNTALFTEAELNIREWNHDAQQIVISISVKEAWYFYIFPILELADRNFNVWWQEHNRSFERLNLGISAHHINLTGVRDRLKLRIQLGYTPKVELNYLLPYFNRAKTLGFSCNALWSTNKEVPYLVENNKQLFYRDDTSPVFRRLRLQAALKYRHNLYMTHEFDLTFYSNRVDDRIASEINPDFFLQSRSNQNYLSLRYRGIYDARDLQLFPMKGLLAGMDITKEGLSPTEDVNSLSLSPFIEYHHPLSRNISIGILGKAQYGLIREKQPFWNYEGLGYGRDYIRGYELYVINGMDYVYGKTSLKARILNAQFNWKRKMPKAFREMPYQLYLTLNYDIGYVNDPYFAADNPLANQIISGGGPGICLVLYHTFALHLEYNFNKLGENGLFLHTKTSF